MGTGAEDRRKPRTATAGAASSYRARRPAHSPARTLKTGGAFQAGAFRSRQADLDPLWGHTKEAVPRVGPGVPITCTTHATSSITAAPSESSRRAHTWLTTIKIFVPLSLRHDCLRALVTSTALGKEVDSTKDRVLSFKLQMILLDNNLEN